MWRTSKEACLKRVSPPQMSFVPLLFPFQQIGKRSVVAREVHSLCPPLAPSSSPQPHILTLRGTLYMLIEQMLNYWNSRMFSMSSNMLLLQCACTNAHQIQLNPACCGFF